MTAPIFNLHSLAASIDFGAIGGARLLLDMILFGACDVLAGGGEADAETSIGDNDQLAMLRARHRRR